MSVTISRIALSIVLFMALSCCTFYRADKASLTVKFDGAKSDIDSIVRRISKEINASNSYSDFNGTSQKYYIIYSKKVNIIIVPIPDNSCISNGKESYDKKIYRFDVVPVPGGGYEYSKYISKKIIRISRDVAHEINIGGRIC